MPVGWRGGRPHLGRTRRRCNGRQLDRIAGSQCLGWAVDYTILRVWVGRGLDVRRSRRKRGRGRAGSPAPTPAIVAGLAPATNSLLDHLELLGDIV